MNLLYTITAYPPSTGGAQNYFHMLAQQMQAPNQVQVASFWDTNRSDWLLGTTLNAPDEMRNYSIDGVQVRRIGINRKGRLSLLPWVLLYYPFMSVALPRIAQVIQDELRDFAGRADLIHNVRVGREGLSLASLQLAQQKGVPFVLTPVHHPRWVGWRYKAFLEIYRRADAVIALTEAERGILASLGVKESRIHVTGMGPVLAESADGNRFLTAHGICGPMILFLGQHYFYKGFQQVLQASKAVWNRVPDACFVFIGPPVGNSEQVFAEHVDPRILRLGKVDLQTKTDALAACKLLCVPSMQESFGGVYTEAWRFAKPVIGGKIPAVSEVIQDGETGFLVEQSPDEIADRICMLLLDERLAKHMGEAGQSRMLREFTWEKIAERTMSAYHAATTSA